MGEFNRATFTNNMAGGSEPSAITKEQSEQGPESSTEKLLLEIQKKITEAFDIFDHEANKTIDLREVGPIVRSLNCCPTEAELKELETELARGITEGVTLYSPAATDEELLQAFRVLDVDGKGYLTKEEMTEIMTSEGENFDEEELEEMMAKALDAEKGYIPYKKYAFTLNPEDEL